MKKAMSLLLGAAMVLSLAGCAGGSAAGSTASSEASSSSEVASSEAVSSEAASSEATTEAAAGATMSYDEYVAAAVDTAVTVETYVQAKQGWWEDKATIYTQNEDGAFFVYDMPCSQEDYDKMTVGTKLKISGFKSEWSGEVEITDATYEFMDGSFIATPFDVTALLGSDSLIDHQNQLVSFKGLTVAPSADAAGNEVAYLYNWDGSGQDGDDLYFNVSLDGNTYTFTVESYLCDNTTDVYAAVKALNVGDTIDCEGFLYWYEGVNPHITAVTPAA